MRKTIVVATRNKGKAAEFREMLAPLGYEVLSLLDMPDSAAPDVVEDGATFAANAEKKARSAAAALGRPALADDSGLVVDALDGAPGVYSARYAGENADDARNNEKLLRELAARGERREDVAPGAAALSAARFVCALALHDPETNETTFAEGACEGFILDEARGAGGFGYDPLFYSPALGKTFGEATPEEKHRLSHRGQALRAMAEKLRT
ncbi:XTP/dITP diphosphatase [Paenibacillus antri]|uniref:dITP/XTP pyrophosphatase n=1 Tax=Paenibacillus antri TaxID=2582848 RepID=A0A5R9GAJ4_9BACL|nr:XTP/dITP diphosphatase [Paenibacillus antri]TLS53487.1 XTP/dITP diphosphatase [Paenibacillus antri]